MNTKTNEPAFPVTMSAWGLSEGLSKRELIAAMALQGMIANPEIVVLSPEEYAKDSLMYADALLAQLKEGE